MKETRQRLMVNWEEEKEERQESDAITMKILSRLWLDEKKNDNERERR